MARGATGGATAPPLRDVRHNGLRGQDFNSGWKFNRGDVTDAQATTFNDSSWRSADAAARLEHRARLQQSSPAGSGGGFLDGGIGWYRKSFTRRSGVERPAHPRRLRRRLHEQRGLDQRHVAGNAAVRLLELRVRSHALRDVRRQQRHRGPRQQQPAQQPLVFGQRHLPQRLADDGQSGPRPLQRRVRVDAVGLGAIGHGVGEHRGAEPVGERRRGHGDDDRSSAPGGAAATSGDSAGTSVAAGATAVGHPDPDGVRRRSSGRWPHPTSIR